MVGVGEVVAIEAVGAVASNRIDRPTAAAEALPAASATPAGSSLMVTNPSAWGTTRKVAVRPSKIRPEAEPFETRIRARLKPVTCSPKSIVTAAEAAFVVPETGDEITGAGAVRSLSIATWLLAELGLPYASAAAPASIDTLTRPSAVGTTEKE